MTDAGTVDSSRRKNAWEKAQVILLKPTAGWTDESQEGAQWEGDNGIGKGRPVGQ